MNGHRWNAGVESDLGGHVKLIAYHFRVKQILKSLINLNQQIEIECDENEICFYVFFIYFLFFFFFRLKPIKTIITQI
jgi:hypothetical protein